MKQKTITLYTYDELPTGKAKEKALNWFLEASSGDEWWDGVYMDAENIGLKITSFDLNRNRHAKGYFMAGAEETAHKIGKDHGEMCRTYKTAKAYLKKRDEAVDSMERSALGDFDDSVLDEKLDELDADFLHDLLEDYSVMLQEESEYLQSREYLEENIRANEYTFREDGRRED